MRISELIEWLYPIEEVAGQTYRVIAAQFRGQPVFAAFLTRLAEDEDGHRRLLERARRLLIETTVDREADILINPESRDQFLQQLQQLRTQAATGALTETGALQQIAQAELSEWNDVFLYALAQFREYSPNFQQIVASIQRHEQHIKDYVAQLTPDQRLSAGFQLLPQVWDQKILVADDEPILRESLELFLGRMGQITTVNNGREALATAQHQFFDAIVSDVNMPEMTGTEFFHAMNKAAIPGRDRFVFVTGNNPDEVQRQCAPARVRVLTKPFKLDDLFATVRSILDTEA